MIEQYGGRTLSRRPEKISYEWVLMMKSIGLVNRKNSALGVDIEEKVVGMCE